MSVTFFVKNKKEIFTINQLTKLVKNLKQFTFDEDDERVDVEEIYNSKLNNVEVMLLGIYGKSARGMEVSYDEENSSYCLRVFTPASSFDWRLAIEFLKKLAGVLNAPIVCENGTTYNIVTIESFDYVADILSGMRALLAKKKSMESLIITGILRPIAISYEMAEKFYKAGDKITALDNFLLKTQYVEAYSAKQMFYQKENGEIFGVYTLTEDVPTVLPYKPYVEFKNWSIVGEVAEWRIVFIGSSDEGDFVQLGELPYSVFIEKLSKEYYYFLDAKYIVVKNLEKNDLLKFLEK